MSILCHRNPDIASKFNFQIRDCSFAYYKCNKDNVASTVTATTKHKLMSVECNKHVTWLITCHHIYVKMLIHFHHFVVARRRKIFKWQKCNGGRKGKFTMISIGIWIVAKHFNFATQTLRENRKGKIIEKLSFRMNKWMKEWTMNAF